jgi:hypothetical protein
MRRLGVRLVALAAVLGAAAPAAAGTVCVNGECRTVPGVNGRATVSMTGTIKVNGGLDGGPGLAPTGIETLVVKHDNVAVYPVVHGSQLGRYGFASGSGIVWIYLGASGCRQIDDDETLVPCHPPDEDP